ncbi:MAG: flagellar filament capping protein FliD, partial [Geobacteraceae bacterium]
GHLVAEGVLLPEFHAQPRGHAPAQHVSQQVQSHPVGVLVRIGREAHDQAGLLEFPAGRVEQERTGLVGPGRDGDESFGHPGHPLAVGCDFQEQVLPKVLEQFNQQIGNLINPYSSDGSQDTVIPTAIKGLNDNITSLNNQVASMQQQLTIEENTLNQEFSNMETTISNTQAWGNELLAGLGVSTSSSTSSSSG